MREPNKNWIGDNTYWYHYEHRAIHVVEDVESSVDTGLLDKDGKKIMKQVKIKPGYY